MSLRSTSLCWLSPFTTLCDILFFSVLYFSIYSTGQIIMDFFLGKNGKLIKSQKLNSTSKIVFSGCSKDKRGRECKKKTTAFHFENCGRRWALKKKITLSMKKKFSMHFSKKMLGEKSVFLEVLHLLLNFEEHRFINK